MYTQEVTLKTGRKVVLAETTAADNMKIIELVGEHLPENLQGSSIMYGYARIMLSIIKYQKVTNETRTLKNKTFTEEMFYRPELKTYKEYLAFLNEFTTPELDELGIYYNEINNEETAYTEKEVKQFTEDATEGKH